MKPGFWDALKDELQTARKKWAIKFGEMQEEIRTLLLNQYGQSINPGKANSQCPEREPNEKQITEE